MIGRIFRVTCLLLGLAGLFWASQKYHAYEQQRSAAEDQLLADSKRNVLKMSLELNRRISQVVDAANLMATDFSRELNQGSLSEQIIKTRLRLEANRNPDILALGLATESGIITSHLYAPYYLRTEQDQLEMRRLDWQFDYLKPKNVAQDWYGKLLRLNGSWAEPDKDILTGELQLVYAVNFTRFDQLTLKDVPAGVVFIALSQNTFQHMVKTLNLGDEGYAFLISEEGKYLAHPDAQLVNSPMVGNTEQPDAAQLALDVQKAIKQEIYQRDGVAGNRPCWYFYEPIPQAGWSLGIVLQKDPTSAVMIEQKYALLEIALLVLVAVILLGVFLFQLQPNFLTGIWLTAIFSSLCIVGVIAFIWYLEITLPVGVEETLALSNQAVLDQRITEVNRVFELENQPPPMHIPTGLFIESLSVDGRDISLAGYLWQKYPLELAPAEDGDPGVVFSTSQGAEFSEAYRFVEGDRVTVGYYFRVSQQQTFASERYPLDQETVAFQMQPARIDQSYLLVPDLDAYSTTNPSGLPGLKPNVLVANWKILASSFSYSTDQRNADFGSSKNIKIRYLPALTFNLTLARSILPSMLSYGITALVIAILMFSLVVSKAESLRGVLTESFALFFVLVVAHVGLRGELAAQGVVYLETVFIILYGLILIGVLNGILEFTTLKIPILSYREGLLFKLFYWPILFGSFLLISLRLFYPNLFHL